MTTISRAYTQNDTSAARVLEKGNEFDSDVAEILRRQISAEILLLNSIDVTVTYEEELDCMRVVSQNNNKAQYNSRYHRVVPFVRKFDYLGDLKWPQNSNQILVNGMFIDPIIVNKNGVIYTVNQYGEVQIQENLRIKELCEKGLKGNALKENEFALKA